MLYLEASSFPCLHLSTSFFGLLPYGLVVCPQFPEEHLSLKLLEWAAFLSLFDQVILTRLGLIWWMVRPHCPSSGFCPRILFFGASPSHVNNLIMFDSNYHTTNATKHAKHKKSNNIQIIKEQTYYMHIIINYVQEGWNSFRGFDEWGNKVLSDVG